MKVVLWLQVENNKFVQKGAALLKWGLTDHGKFGRLVIFEGSSTGPVKGEVESSRKFEFAEPEVKSIRDKIGLSQIRFAGLIGVSKRTLENWEQGRRHPTGPARALLRILDKDPEHAVRDLNS